MKSAVIIVPTYNESGNIEKLVETIFGVTQKIDGWNIDLLIVDSTSPDHTGEIVKDLQKKYKRLHCIETKKEGLGKAYIHGFSYAIDHLKPQVLFEMDADLSHDPKKIPEFLNAIENGADFVIGARYMKGGSIPSDWGIHRKAFSILANLFVRFGFLKLRITDWTSGYRAIKSWVIKDSLQYINNYSGYVFQIAILDNALKNHAVIKEVPIHFIDRKAGKSKINAAQYITQTVWYVLSHSSFIKFAIVGGLGFCIDFGLFSLGHFVLKLPTWGANLISTESAVIFNFLMNNYWSFAHKKIKSKGNSFFKQFVKFNLISSGSIAIQTIGLELMKHFFGSQYLLFYKVGIIFFIVIPYSYILYNKVVWKDKK